MSQSERCSALKNKHKTKRHIRINNGVSGVRGSLTLCIFDLKRQSLVSSDSVRNFRSSSRKHGGLSAATVDVAAATLKATSTFDPAAATLDAAAATLDAAVAAATLDTAAATL